MESKTNALLQGCGNTVIPRETERIESIAFSDNELLDSIDIPENVKQIGYRAFLCCKNLKSVTFHEGLEKIGKEAFRECTKLEEIYIPSTVKEIGKAPFRETGNIQKIVVDKNNENYNSGDNCNVLIDSTTDHLIAGSNNAFIPYGVTVIEEFAFYNCTTLQEIEIPESVAVIEDDSFTYCSGIKKLTIPCSVKVEGEVSAFYGVNGIEKLTVTKGNGVMDDNIGRAWRESGKSIKEIYLEEGITNVSIGAFRGFEGITKLVIPESVTAIGRNSFWGCYNLKELTMPCSVKIYNDENTFGGCFSIEKIILTKGTGCMPDYAPDGEGENTYYRNTPWNESYDNLKEIILEDGIEYIGEYTFWDSYDGYIEKPEGYWNYYKGLTITFPQSVKEVGNYAFSAGVSVKSYCKTAPYELAMKQGNRFESLGHVWTEYAINKEPTCDADGTITAICEGCGAVGTY